MFSNSVIKDICYHGTDSVTSITTLNKSLIQKNPEQGDSGYFGWGFYLTKDKDYAKEFGDNVLKFYVDIKKPYILPNDENKKPLIDYIFKDSDKGLQKNIQDTLYTIRLIGREKAGDFENSNSKETLLMCRELYIKFKGKVLTEKEIEEFKSKLVILAEDVNNWLNGLFFYFGKQLFHYFTFNDYDGVIAKDGQEIVVYETRQIEPVKDVNEDVDSDLDLEVNEVEDYTVQGEEYTKQYFDELKRLGATNIEIPQTIYPLRKDPVWYDWEMISFEYKGLVKVTIYSGGEFNLYLNEDESLQSKEELEEEGIFTDRALYDLGRQCDFAWDDYSSYIGFGIQIIGDPRNEVYYHYDLGYEDEYEIYVPEDMDWFINNVVKDFMHEYRSNILNIHPDAEDKLN